MKYMTIIVAVLVAVLTLIAACGQGSAPVVLTVTPSPETGAPKPPPGAARAGWEQKWEDTLAAAKREGEVLLYLNAPTEARVALAEAFNKKFGINLDVVIGAGSDIAAKVIAEYRAGIFQADVLAPGASSALNAKANGITSPIEPMLILPEVKDPAVWVGGNLPFYDKEGFVVGYLSQRMPHIFYNSEMVKEGQITTHADLLKPEWKGKMAMYDPTIAGASSGAMARLVMDWGVDRSREWLASLVKEQDVVITRDMRGQMEWLIRGKYPVAIFAQSPAVAEFLKVRAPIGAANVKERLGLTPSAGGLAMLNKPAHPNATLVFLNWFLSREGQALVVKTMDAPSARVDVPAEGVAPMWVLRPEDKFIIHNAEVTALQNKLIDEWKKVFAQAGK